MELHKQIRNEQSSFREKLKQKDIEIKDFISKMNKLNKELFDVEKEMYEEHSSIKTENLQQKDTILKLEETLKTLKITNEEHLNINLNINSKNVE